MSYLMAGLAVALMVLGYVFRKAPAMLAATVCWAIFGVYVGLLTGIDITIRNAIASFGGVMTIYCAVQALYLMGVMPRSKAEPEKETRLQMENVRRQVAIRRMSTRTGENLNDFDHLVKRSQARLARDRINRKGYRIS